MTDGRRSQIWVYGDLRNDRFFAFGLNVLAKARGLARSVSGKAAMVLVGSPQKGISETSGPFSACKPLADAQKEALAHGADMVYIAEHADLCMPPRADGYAAVMADLVRGERPDLVLFALTDFGRELASRLARMIHSGLIADCMDLRVGDCGIIASCPSWGGQIVAEIGFSDGSKTGLATVQPHAFRAEKASGDPGIVKRVTVEPHHGHGRLTLVSCEPDDAHQKLEEADIVVVGGAGLGSIDGFGMVRDLSAALGGEVAATRPPVLQHWIDEDRMIGQTGKTVHPKLLLSIGTSGAVQYTAGITESGKIVAINRDQNSPIFQVADIGIVADARTFLPVLTAKVKQTMMRKMADTLCHDRGAGEHKEFGEKVCKLRESYGWSRETLAEATDQTPEFIEQVENDEFEPPVSFLLRLAKALKVDPDTFLRKEEQEIIRGHREQSFIKRTRNYSYQTLTPGAERAHLRAFMVTIESRRAHKPVEYKHEGEEFIYVMDGELEVTLGGKNHHLKTDECIHFNSETPHKLKSLSSSDTRCLVVLYTV